MTFVTGYLSALHAASGGTARISAASHCLHHVRLLDNPARTGVSQTRSRCSAGRSLRGCPPDLGVWLSIGLRSRRAPCRGVAPEGTAQLAVAMPASQSPIRRGKGEYGMATMFIGVAQ